MSAIFMRSENSMNFDLCMLKLYLTYVQKGDERVELSIISNYDT